MNDEELDNVAGGTFEELRQDAQEFRKVFGGPIRFNRQIGIGHAAIASRSDIVAGFAKFGVKMTWDNDKPNEYFIDGNKVTREEAWNHVKEAMVDKTTD